MSSDPSSCVFVCRARIFVDDDWSAAHRWAVMMVFCITFIHLNSVTSIEIYEGENVNVRVFSRCHSRLLMRGIELRSISLFADCSACVCVSQCLRTIQLNEQVKWSANKCVCSETNIHTQQQPCQRWAEFSPLYERKEKQLSICWATVDGNMRSLS